VVLELPQYFFQCARKLAQNLLDSDSDLIETSQHAASSPLTSVAVRRHLVAPQVGGPVLKFVSSKKVSPLFSNFWSDRRIENSLFRSPGVG
jgi:hypothetical protein